MSSYCQCRDPAVFVSKLAQSSKSMFPRSQCKRNLLAAPDVVVDRISGQCLALKVVHVRTTPAVQLDIYLLGQGSWSDRVSVHGLPEDTLQGLLSFSSVQIRLESQSLGKASRAIALTSGHQLLRKTCSGREWQTSAGLILLGLQARIALATASASTCTRAAHRLCAWR